MTSAASTIAARLRSRTATSRPAAPSASKPPVSTRSTARSSKIATASLASRVTPGVGSTSAFRRRSRRLKSVDLPAFGRPTSTIRGSATVDGSADASAPSAATAVSVATASPRTAATDGARRDGRRLEPDLAEDTRVLAPFTHDLHVQLEKHAAAEDRFELQARRLADVADAPAALAYDDALLRRPLDEDRRLDDEEIARRLLAERVDDDCRRVRQLVARLLDDLLAHDL